VRRDLGRVLRGELRHLLRDPATLLLVFVLPLVVLPLSLWSFHTMDKAREGDEIDGDEEPLTVGGSAEIADWIGEGDGIRWVDGEVGDEGGALAEINLDHRLRQATVAYRSSSADSRRAATRLGEVVRRQGDEEVDAVLAAAGVQVTRSELVVVEGNDHATARQRTGLRVGRILPLALIFLVLTGALYTALDVFTGEKERGTLETLLSSRVDRRSVVIAKFSTVLLLSLAAGAVGLIAFTGAVAAGAMRTPDGELVLSAGTAGVLAALLMPVAVQLAAAMTVIAAYAPDYKRGQALAMPAMLLVVAPAGLAAMPGIELGAALALVPVAGVALAMRDALAGDLGWGMGGLVTAASLVWATAAIWAGARLMGRETVLLGGRSTASRHARGNHVPEALGLFGATLLLLWFLGSIGQQASMTWGMLFTQIVLLAGPALVAVLYLGLPLRRTLSMRDPHPADLLLAVVAGLGLPAIGLTLSALQDPIVPVPDAFAQQMREAVLGDHSLLVVLATFALLPAICEEILFRGAIQGMLRRSLPPLALCLLVGILFGAFHLSVSRALPTGALGALLAYAALRTRSLAVPIVMHALNNGLMLAAAHQGWLGEEADLSPGLLAGGGVLALLACAGMGRFGRPRGG
jgi:sodium transport system permease protein